MSCLLLTALFPLLASPTPSLHATPPRLPAQLATPLPAARIPFGDDGVWVAVDGQELLVAWEDDGQFERVELPRASGGSARTLDTSRDRHGERGAQWGSTSASRRDCCSPDPIPGGGGSIRVGALDDGTLLLVGTGGDAWTLLRGAAHLEDAASLEAGLDEGSLAIASHDLALTSCSDTGRWPARALGEVTWVAWSACDRVVRCAPLRLSARRRAPTGVQATLSIGGTVTHVTSVATQTSVPSTPDQGVDGGGPGGAVTIGGLLADEPAPPRPPGELEAARERGGIVSLLLTLRFDPRAAARGRVATDLASRRDTTPIPVEVVDALGANDALALVCGGVP